MCASSSEDVSLWARLHVCSTELGSGIVSAALQCGTGRCPTENLELDTPVRITIQHSEEVEVHENSHTHTHTHTYIQSVWCRKINYRKIVIGKKPIQALNHSLMKSFIQTVTCRETAVQNMIQMKSTSYQSLLHAAAMWCMGMASCLKSVVRRQPHCLALCYAHVHVHVHMQ